MPTTKTNAIEGLAAGRDMLLGAVSSLLRGTLSVEEAEAAAALAAQANNMALMEYRFRRSMSESEEDMPLGIAAE